MAMPRTDRNSPIRCWVAYGARDLPQVLAHELVHVLSDSGAHSDEVDNLMGIDTAPGATRLTDGQCERLRTHGEANGLLIGDRRERAGRYLIRARMPSSSSRLV